MKGAVDWCTSSPSPVEPDGHSCIHGRRRRAGFSYNGMVVDRFGNFYGATVHDGSDDDGYVYKLLLKTAQPGTQPKSNQETCELPGCPVIASSALWYRKKYRFVILSKLIIYTAKRGTSFRDCTQCLNGNRWENNGETLLAWPFLFRPFNRV